MKKLFLLVGLLVSALVAVGVYLFVVTNRPVIIEVPVAINDIPEGTVVNSAMFRIAKMSNIDARTLDRWITVSDFETASGKLLTSDVRAGFPLAKVQIDPNSVGDGESRLSLLATGPNEYYIALPVKPDDGIGNFVQPGDFVDLIVALGDMQNKDITQYFTPTLVLSGTDAVPLPELPSVRGAAANVKLDANALDPNSLMTQTLLMPAAKLVVQDLEVIRVEREQPRDDGNTTQDETEPDPRGFATGKAAAFVRALDVKRMYVKVTRDQLEVLRFAMVGSRYAFAVRGNKQQRGVSPTEGVTWDDFAVWFYSQRGYKTMGPQPFVAVGPYTQTTTVQAALPFGSAPAATNIFNTTPISITVSQPMTTTQATP